jgi:modification methylase
MVLTSPPYNRGTTTGGGFNNGGLSQQLTGAYAGYADNLPVDQYREWQANLLRSWWDMLSDEGAIYYNHRPRVQSGLFETPLDWNPGLPVRQIIIWHSGSGVNFAPTHYRISHEWIVLFSKPNFRLLSKSISGVGDVWQFGAAHINGHPAPFPVGLAEQAIGTTNCKIIYEPFSGSGTTIIACENLKRKCRAIEISPGYVAVTLERYFQHTGKKPVLAQ